MEMKDRAQEYCLLEIRTGGHWEGKKRKTGKVKAKLLTLQFCEG